MTSRSRRAQIAEETLAILRAGEYVAPSGARVALRASVDAAVAGSYLVTPADSPALLSKALAIAARRRFATAFEVRNETTFAAARRLAERHGPERTAALNFASAKHAGGGFLGGAQAQEECLARASALYLCLERHRGYYDANRACGTCLYTDHLIVAPRVPVFRDDADRPLERPWETTILTSPAPNAGALASNEPKRLAELEPTFRRRIEQVLSAAIAADQTALVLGAWGCGVFRNDPATVARLFGEFLLGDGPYAAAFERVAFAVLDPRGDSLAAFAAVFDRPD